MEIAQRPRRVAKRRRKAVDETPKQAEEVAEASAPESSSAMAIETQNETVLPDLDEESSTSATTPARRVAKRRRKDTATTTETSPSSSSVEPHQQAEKAIPSPKANVEETTGPWWEAALQLEDRFAALDMTLVCNRKGPTLFPAAQQGVQTLSQRPFSLAHLSLIKTIYPEAYMLQVRKTHPKEKLLHPSCGPYVLTLALPPGPKPAERKATFRELLATYKTQNNIASTAAFDVPPSPLPEVPTAASLAQAKSAKSSHTTAAEREEPCSSTEATREEEDDATAATATKAKRNDNTKEAREERYAAVLRRVKEREARLAAAGSPEVQKEAFLLKSLPQLNLVLRSLFVVKKFKPIPLDEALTQLCSSYRDAFGLSLERQDVERRLRMLNELMPDMLQTKEGMDRNAFLVLPRGAIPGDRLQAAIEAKQQQQQQQQQQANQKMEL